MVIDYNAEEITATLTEDCGRQEGFAKRKPGKPMTFTVATRFGAAKTRFVQGLAEKMGGGVMYIESRGAGARPAPRTLVVLPARTGSLAGDGRAEGFLRAAGEFIRAAMQHGREVVVYGSQRVRWKLSVKCGRYSENLRDSEDLTNVAPSRGAARGKLRREF